MTLKALIRGLQAEEISVRTCAEETYLVWN